MKITITFQLKQTTKPQTIYLSPEEYLEPIEEGESYKKDALPIYDKTHKYIDHEAKDLKWAILTIISDNHKRIIRSQYLNGKSSVMEHIIDADGSEEIIISTEIDRDRLHIISVFKHPQDYWSVRMNNLTDESSELEVTSKYYEGDWSWEDCKSFCHIPEKL